MPVIAFGHNRTPEVAVGADDLAEGGGVALGVGEGLFDAVDHALETFDLGGEVFAARFGAFDAKAELKIFFVADEDIRCGGDFLEDGAAARLRGLSRRRRGS